MEPEEDKKDREERKCILGQGMVALVSGVVQGLSSWRGIPSVNEKIARTLGGR